MWQMKPFDQLDTKTLYEILRLRNNVFIVEQDCPYADLDRLDYEAIHIYCLENGEIMAYCRILQKNTRFEELSIGRVLTSQAVRSKGYGKKLLKEALSYIENTLKESAVRISAQAYLKDFYSSFGFTVVSEEYLEDGIPHFEMLCQGKNQQCQ